MKLFIIPAMLSVVFFQVAHCQVPLADLPDNEKKVDSVYSIAWSLVFDHPDSALLYGEYQKELAEELNYQMGKAKALYVIGNAYNELNNFDSAAQNYYRGLRMISGSRDKESKRRQMLFKHCLGILFYDTEVKNVALNYFSDALRSAEELEDFIEQEILNYNIALTYIDKMQYDSAEKYLEQTLRICDIISSNAKKAWTYKMYGKMHALKKEYAQSTDYFLKALELGTGMEDFEKEAVPIVWAKIGDNFLYQGNMTAALENYEKGVEVSRSLRDYANLKLNYNNMGDAYLRDGNYDMALEFFEKSIALGKSGIVDKELNRAYIQSAYAYDSLGSFQRASHFKTRYLNELEQAKEQQIATFSMREMAARMEQEKQREALIKKEQADLRTKILLGLLAIAVLVSLYIAYRYYKKITKARNIVNLFTKDISLK